MIKKYTSYVNESKEDYEYLKKYVIYYDNLSDCVLIGNTLNDLGLSVFDYENIGSENWRNFNCFCKGYRFDFTQANKSGLSRGRREVNIDEFLELIKNKPKIIERPDIDPYGEEDWNE